MRKITVLALILILSLTVTILVGAKDIQKVTDAESKEDLNKLRGDPPIEDDYQETAPMAVEQATYTDMWLQNSKTMIETSSTSWANMPGMSINITTKYSSDMLIMFSGEVLATDRLNLRILVDDMVAQPGEIMLISRIGNYNSHSFDFYKKNIPAGKHSIKVQWRSESPSPEFARAGCRTLNIIANGAGHP